MMMTMISRSSQFGQIPGWLVWLAGHPAGSRQRNQFDIQHRPSNPARAAGTARPARSSLRVHFGELGAGYVIYTWHPHDQVRRPQRAPACLLDGRSHRFDGATWDALLQDIQGYNKSITGKTSNHGSREQNRTTKKPREDLPGRSLMGSGFWELGSSITLGFWEVWNPQTGLMQEREDKSTEGRSLQIVRFRSKRC